MFVFYSDWSFLNVCLFFFLQFHVLLVLLDHFELDFGLQFLKLNFHFFCVLRWLTVKLCMSHRINMSSSFYTYSIGLQLFEKPLSIPLIFILVQELLHTKAVEIVVEGVVD